VIFRIDPEDRDRRDPVIARHLLGELQRSERLQHREQRPAEQPRLLTGDDRDRARLGEQPRRLARARRRLTPVLLRGDHARDRVAAAILRLRPRNRVGPRAAIGGIAREERSDRREGAPRVRLLV